MDINNLRPGVVIKEPMKLALALAKAGEYSVSPNPMVGAVIIKNDCLVGYGVHLFQGDLHAEIKAIKMAGIEANNAKLYLNLEPCCHHGLTPPCVDEIINAGISEVHFSSIDPNPLVTGKSVAILQKNNIKTFIGEMNSQAEDLNASFFYNMKNNLPFVIAKWAMTVDGRIASKTDSKWISNDESRNHSHLLRNSVDAVLVGIGTLNKDNPHLNVRLNEDDVPAKIRQPYKLVIGSKFELIDLELNIFKNNPDKVILISDEDSIMKLDLYKKNILINWGVKFISLSKNNDSFDLNQLLKELHNIGIRSVLVEGGSQTLSRFLASNLINKFYCYIAAKFIAGENSLSPFNLDIGINSIIDAKLAKFTKVTMLANDILIEGNF